MNSAGVTNRDTVSQWTLDAGLWVLWELTSLLSGFHVGASTMTSNSISLAESRTEYIFMADVI